MGTLVGTLVGALVGVFVGPLVGTLVDPLVGSNFAVRVLCACLKLPSQTPASDPGNVRRFPREPFLETLLMPMSRCLCPLGVAFLRY